MQHNKTSKYLNFESVEKNKIFLFIEKLSKFIHKIKTDSCELQSYLSKEFAKEKFLIFRPTKHFE